MIKVLIFVHIAWCMCSKASTRHWYVNPYASVSFVTTNIHKLGNARPLDIMRCSENLSRVYDLPLQLCIITTHYHHHVLSSPELSPPPKLLYPSFPPHVSVSFP